MTTISLFDGALGTTPAFQEELTLQQILPPPFAPAANERVEDGVVILDTDFNGNNTGYVGYTNYDIVSIFPPQVALVNTEFPDLLTDIGFSLSFGVEIDSATSFTNNRAGFNVIVVNNDGSNEIELGFTEDRIFAQAQGFVSGEEVDFNTTIATDYELKIKDNNYNLFANGTEILTGSLRNYNFDPNASQPPLPFNPYDLPNFIFVGDNTDQSSAIFRLSYLEVNIPIPTTFSFDIDGDGDISANTDGLLIYGYLNIRDIGVPNLVNNLTQQLADNLINPNGNATRTTGTAIADYIESNIDYFDIDGDGDISANIDGLLSYGYFNIRGIGVPSLVNNLTQQLADNLIPDNSAAIRTSATDIINYFNTYIL